jgi:F420-dependent oxidoreductase-like protein
MAAIDVALMIEGQNGLNWARWKQVAEIAEGEGFAGLYRSDHFTNATPPERDSLEVWVSLAWLASHTSRIEFGPLVCPMSFRHPSLTARMAAAVDDLSNGRMTLGLGAGWQQREHTLFGLDLLDVPQRFQRFEEGLEVITGLLRESGPVSCDGEYYQLRDAVLLPRPARPGGPPVLIGGNGALRTLPLAAAYADEWNAVFLPPARFAELNGRLDQLLDARGRPRKSVRRSMMTGCWLAASDSELDAMTTRRNLSFEQLRDRGIVVGTSARIVEQIAELGRLGVQRVMLQWLNLEDLDGIRRLGREVASRF